MSNFCSADNPYDGSARDARECERQRRKAERIPIPEMTDKGKVMTLAKYPAETYNAYVGIGIDNDIARDFARKTGVNLVDTPSGVKQYVVATPTPRDFPYHPLENPHGTRVPFDEAVKTYDQLKAEREKRNRNRRCERN